MQESIKKYIHWLSVHLAGLQVLGVLDVDAGLGLPDHYQLDQMTSAKMTT